MDAAETNLGAQRGVCRGGASARDTNVLSPRRGSLRGVAGSFVVAGARAARSDEAAHGAGRGTLLRNALRVVLFQRGAVGATPVFGYGLLSGLSRLGRDLLLRGE